MAAGVVAVLHVGKLPSALPVLGQMLGASLLQAGVLLSLVQPAGMTLGLVTGLAGQRVGLKRSMVGDLLVIAPVLAGCWRRACWRVRDSCGSSCRRRR